MAHDPHALSDHELEAQARAQAEAIAQQKQEAIAAAQVGVPGVFRGLGRAVRRSKETVSSSVVAVQKPGRELLLWQMRQATELAAAWDIAHLLLEEPRFAHSVPAGKDWPIAEFRAQRSWAEAAAEWSRMGGGNAETWLKCDRQLTLRRDGTKVCFGLRLVDICVHFDAQAQKLTPIKVNKQLPLGHSGLAMLQEKLPSVGVAALSAGLRSPTRALQQERARAAPDAYVRNGSLLPPAEGFGGAPKKAPEASQDAGRGFLTWLSQLVKSNNAQR